MKKMIALACLGFAFTVSAPAFSAGEKMKGCSKEATGMKGDERKMFMKKCLSKEYVLGSGMAAPDAAALAAFSAQEKKRKACAAEAGTKKLKGAERKAFMNTCVES